MKRGVFRIGAVHDVHYRVPLLLSNKNQTYRTAAVFEDLIV
jgi:5-hydroxyisourate hydrolase-like protein (transthyretin family)